MSQRPFSRALLLKLPAHGTFVADSVWELDEYLDLFWPQDDPDLPSLKRLCRDALDGWADPEIVRTQAYRLAQKLDIVEAQRGSVHYRAIKNNLEDGDTAA